MNQTITIKQGDFYYIVPMHEFSRYWLAHLDYVQVTKIPYDKIPLVSIKGALKRGKGVKRVIKAYESKGSGKHGSTTYSNR
jgi:hypothetical protein